MRRLIAFALALSVVGNAAPVLARSSYVFGPPPDWARYRELGTAAALAKVADPRLWAVDWPNGYIASRWYHKGIFRGYLTCGLLRATAPVNGLWPRVNFAAVIDYDQVKLLDVSQKMANSIVNLMCAMLVDHGYLPPASLMDPSHTTAAGPPSSSLASASPIRIATFGLTIRPMAEGAYVTAVDANSPADQAKLAPGFVITRANGIALGGLGEAMAKVLDADQPAMSIETATGDKTVIRPSKARP